MKGQRPGCRTRARSIQLGNFVRFCGGAELSVCCRPEAATQRAGATSKGGAGGGLRPRKFDAVSTEMKMKRLYRSPDERKIAGVCGGLGEFLDIDPVFFRALFVVLAFIAGLGILLYIALWLVMPEASAVPAADPDRPRTR